MKKLLLVNMLVIFFTGTFSQSIITFKNGKIDTGNIITATADFITYIKLNDSLKVKQTVSFNDIQKTEDLNKPKDNPKETAIPGTSKMPIDSITRSEERRIGK